MKRLLIICLVAFCLTSCFKNNLIPTYHGVANIYFTTAKIDNAFKLPDGFGRNSLTVSFGLIPSKEDSLVKIPVRITGKIVDYDRKYRVKILRDTSTAKKGVNFSFYKEDFTIEAGEYADSIQIMLKNASTLGNGQVFVAFKLVPNEYFSTKLDHKIINGDTLSFTKFKLYSSHIIEKPKNWWAYYLGRFTDKKFLLMGEVLDINLRKFDKIFTTSKLSYWAITMQDYLDKQAEKGNIIYNKDGTRMKMGSAVN